MKKYLFLDFGRTRLDRRSFVMNRVTFEIETFILSELSRIKGTLSNGEDYRLFSKSGHIHYDGIFYQEIYVFDTLIVPDSLKTFDPFKAKIRDLCYTLRQNVPYFERSLIAIHERLSNADKTLLKKTETAYKQVKRGGNMEFEVGFHTSRAIAEMFTWHQFQEVCSEY